MGDESAKRAAQEFLAAKIIEEGQTREAQLNQEAAITLGPTLWKRVASTVTSQCRDWNSVTNEQSLTCKRHSAISASCVPEGPIRWSCIMDSRKGFIIIKNSARPENEPDTILRIVGYSNGSGRDAHLVRSTSEPVNLELLILGHLRVLAGLSRLAE